MEWQKRAFSMSYQGTSLQVDAGLLVLGVDILILLLAIYVAFAPKSTLPKEEIAHKVYGARKVYFFFISAVLILALFTTLPFTPYPQFKKIKPALVVRVIGRQWAWSMNGSNTITVPADKLIEFQVTSSDVNHGFGIYNPQGELVAQTQAMPGFVNKLKYTFHKPGEYKVLCLELCGVAHYMMAANIEVIQSK